jgi:hypothetical protein
MYTVCLLPGSRQNVAPVGLKIASLHESRNVSVDPA